MLSQQRNYAGFLIRVMSNIRPVLIGGCDRSGTTLLGAMLGAHPDCICTPEAQFKIEVLQRLDLLGELENIERAAAYIEEHWRFRIWRSGIDPNAAPFDDISSYADLLAWVVRSYGSIHGKPDAHVWVNHDPGNVKYATTLFELFPNAKLIHIVRDGRAVAASLMKMDGGPNVIISAADFWRSRLAGGLAAETAFGPDRVMRVRYEDLITNPESALRRISNFAEIDYVCEMQAGGGLAVPPYAERTHRRIGSPPEPDRANAWQRELTLRQVEIFEYITGDLLAMMGYSPCFGRRAQQLTRWENWTLYFQDALRTQFVNRFQSKWRRYRGQRVKWSRSNHALTPDAYK